MPKSGFCQLLKNRGGRLVMGVLPPSLRLRSLEPAARLAALSSSPAPPSDAPDGGVRITPDVGDP
eukprot:15454009-Alexandrium_andersonii.AAC.1